jgi:hypothetical protein
MDEPVIQPDTNVGNFEALWKIIDTRYCYLDYKQINWDSIHSVYKQRVDTVKSQFSLFNVLGDMLDELRDGHVNLYSDFDLSRYWKWFTDYPPNFDSKLIYNARYLGDNYLIAGGIRYQKIDGGKIGYIYYGDFSNNFSNVNFSHIFNYFADCKNGLIIDVRDNGGGYLDLSEDLASYFFKNTTLTGYICHKTGNGHADFSKPTEIKTSANKNLQWQRPVIILTNRMSFSATNAFVSRMKLAPNATIVGDKTGGGGGLPMSSEIPNGWMVRFSSSPMFDANMNQIEWGINPDVKVDLNPLDVANGYDTIIERAIKLLK